MVKRALIILLLISAPLIAGESGLSISVRANGQTYTYPLFEYPEDVHGSAVDPFLTIPVEGVEYFVRLKPANTATAQEVVRLNIQSTYVSGIFAIGETSPHSRNYTPEKFFVSTGRRITGYLTSLGAPLNPVLPPRIGGVVTIALESMGQAPITSIDWGGFSGRLLANALQGTHITSLTIPQNISVDVAEHAAANCPYLTSVTINKPEGGAVANYFTSSAHITNLVLGAVLPTYWLRLGTCSFYGTTRVTFGSDRNRYDFTWSTDYPHIGSGAFKDNQKLVDAFTLGGAGTYAYNGSDWVKE